MTNEMGNSDTKILDTDPSQIPDFAFSGRHVAKIIDVHDGDTCTAIIVLKEESSRSDCGCGRWQKIPIKIKIRIQGIDCPETTKNHGEKYSKLASEATEFTKNSILGKHCEVDIVSWDKFGGRVVGSIYTAKGESVGRLLLEKKLALPYDGKTKKKTEEEYMKTITETS